MNELETAEQEREQRLAAARDQFETANRRFFERECKAAGIDPARGVSPSLLKTLEVGETDGETIVR